MCYVRASGSQRAPALSVKKGTRRSADTVFDLESSSDNLTTLLDLCHLPSFVILRARVFVTVSNRVRRIAVVAILLPEHSRTVHVPHGLILPALNCVVPRHSDVSR